MTELNIVELIEKNPITNLTNTYQNKLITKIKENFNDDEQHLFVASFYCYLNCIENEFIIDLDNIWQWLGFKQKQNAKTLLEKQFRNEIDYKILLMQQHKLKKDGKDGRGGHLHQTIMLTIEAFKLFCITAGTERAKQIHKYYIKLERTLQEVIKEECNDFKLQLEEQKKQLENKDKILEETKQEKDKILEETKQEKDKKREKTIIQNLRDKNVVYICKIEDHPTEEDKTKFIVKIGSSHNIKHRLSGIINTYNKNAKLLEVFECYDYINFETFLHKHSFITNYSYVMELSNGIKTTETYLVNQEQYNYFVKIITDNIQQFKQKTLSFEELNKIEEEKRKTEQEIQKKLELQLQINQIEIKKLELQLELTKEQNKVVKVEPKKEEIKLENYVIKNRNNSRSPFVHQYDGLPPHNLIKIFECEINVSRELPEISASALKIASRKNKIYKGYRWLLVDKTNTEPVVLPPTVESRQQYISYIAMIDVKQTKIEKVYASQKEGAIDNGLANNGVSTISRAIKQASMSCHRYWKYWNDCSQEMQNEYLKSNELPEKYVSANGLRVLQIDPKTDAVVETHLTKTDVIKKFQMSSTTLNNASKKNEVCKGFKWKIQEP
jgi:hypothetical protein